MSDDGAMGIAQAAKRSLSRIRPSASRVPIAIGVSEQSVGHGSVLTSDKAAWPQAFASLRKPGDRVPHYPAVTGGGGYWSYVQDALWDWGYDATIVNGAVGSSSIITDWAGFFSSGSTRNNTSYCQKRAPSWAGDPGYAGDLILVPGVGYFRCTRGNHMTFVANGQRPFPVASAAATRADQDFRVAVAGGDAVGGTFCTTGASEPVWPTVTGATVVDGAVGGGIEWTLEYKGGANITYPSPGSVFTPTNTPGYGFDGAGLCHRVDRAMQAVPADIKLIVGCTTQSDLGATAARFASAIQAVGTYFLSGSNCDIYMPALSCFKPDAVNAVANYDTLKAGMATAVSALQATYGAKVQPGGDLYTAMGTTGPMALGGSFLQADNTHLTGAGCVGPDVSGVPCAGKVWANAIKAVLPQRIIA